MNRFTLPSSSSSAELHLRNVALNRIAISSSEVVPRRREQLFPFGRAGYNHRIPVRANVNQTIEGESHAIRDRVFFQPAHVCTDYMGSNQHTSIEGDEMDLDIATGQQALAGLDQHAP